MACPPACVRVEPLRRNEFRRRPLKSCSVRSRLVAGRHRSQHRNRADTNTAARIGEQWRDKRPDPIPRKALKHVERADPYEGIWIAQALAGKFDVGGRYAPVKFAKRTGPCDRRRCGACRNRRQQGGSVAPVGPGSAESFGVVLETSPERPVPVLYDVRGPLGGFVGMAIVARVWRPNFHREVRPWYPQAVIVPFIDRHVDVGRHMARHAFDLRCDVVVMAMRGDLIFVGGLALQADAVA